MPIKLDGKEVASRIKIQLKEDVHNYKERNGGKTPHLAVLMVGDNYASRMYTRMKARMARDVGMECTNIDLPAYTPARNIILRIVEYNLSPVFNGIMLQHPVPKSLLQDERRFLDTISPEKDVDGLTTTNFGKLSLGLDELAFQPATPKGIMTLLHYYDVKLKNMTVTIIGSSPILGLPLSMLLHRAGATVCIVNINTKIGHLVELCQMSDMIVGACGKPGIVTSKLVKEGAILIDAGCNPGNVGDIDPRAYEKSSFYTPLPGGVGPMTTITLLSQTMQAAEEQENDH
jgi:methylenetetrahydrofolate dehydrogenase (NADP+) / methenyltetrahydrofolate cyclohydrolase